MYGIAGFLIVIAVAKLIRAAPNFRTGDLFLAALLVLAAISYFMRARNPKTCSLRWSAELLEFRPIETKLDWIPVEKVVEDGVSFQLIGQNHRHSLFLEKNAISPDLQQFLRSRK